MTHIIDAFLQVMYTNALEREAVARAQALMAQVPEQDLLKVAGLVPEPCRISKNAADDDSWISKYEGTPLHEQALQLEQASLGVRQQRLEHDALMEQERDSRPNFWRQEDAIRLKKDLLDLELSRLKSGVPAPASAVEQALPSAGAPAAAAASPEIPTTPTPGAVQALLKQLQGGGAKEEEEEEEEEAPPSSKPSGSFPPKKSEESSEPKTKQPPKGPVAEKDQKAPKDEGAAKEETKEAAAKFASFMNAASDIGRSVYENAANAGKAVGSGASVLGQQVGAGLNQAGKAIGDFRADLGQRGIDAIQDAAGQVGNLLQQGHEKTRGAIAGVRQITHGVGGIAKDLHGTAKDVAGTLREGRDLWEEGRGAVRGLANLFGDAPAAAPAAAAPVAAAVAPAAQEVARHTPLDYALLAGGLGIGGLGTGLALSNMNKESGEKTALDLSSIGKSLGAAGKALGGAAKSTIDVAGTDGLGLGLKTGLNRLQRSISKDPAVLKGMAMGGAGLAGAGALGAGTFMAGRASR